MLRDCLAGLGAKLCFHVPPQRSYVQLARDIPSILSPESSPHRNFTADATAFVVTLPVVSAAGTARLAARAWESEFVRVAEEQLGPMAAAANLTLSFSTERWGVLGGESCMLCHLFCLSLQQSICGTCHI